MKSKKKGRRECKRKTRGEQRAEGGRREEEVRDRERERESRKCTKCVNNTEIGGLAREVTNFMTVTMKMNVSVHINCHWVIPFKNKSQGNEILII